MNITQRLQSLTRLFLDTAPVIYFVEKNPNYLARVKPVFESIDAGTCTAVTSPVTLAECLVYPYRLGHTEGVRAFTDLIAHGNHTTFALIDNEIARRAAELRARHNLALADAFQIATALNVGCDAFLTNDVTFKRVTELDVIVLDDLETE
ncbi:hypothetical protein ANRL3_00447 [Anaerolineae bacterium]|nr:hypothetical protein ANRL3_00447 [Anaerolineae bacterium]